jgi:two-component system nitrate/nitrite response regulator NarP
MTRILIADDHRIIVTGLEAMLRDTDYEVVGSVADGRDVPAAVARLRPDILLLDVSMPGQSGIDVLRVVSGCTPSPAVVLLTAGLADAELIDAVRLGVQGIVLKQGAHHLLRPCLEAVRAGSRWIDPTLLQRTLDLTLGGGEVSDPYRALTARERSITVLAAQGLRNRDIAGRLALNEGTVKVYLHRIYRKLGVATRTELAILVRSSNN